MREDNAKPRPVGQLRRGGCLGGATANVATPKRHSVICYKSSVSKAKKPKKPKKLDLSAIRTIRGGLQAGENAPAQVMDAPPPTDSGLTR